MEYKILNYAHWDYFDLEKELNRLANDKWIVSFVLSDKVLLLSRIIQTAPRIRDRHIRASMSQEASRLPDECGLP